MNNPYLILTILFAALLCAPLSSAQDAAPADRNAVNTKARPGGMMADSPVTFPKEGALPAKYPPDIKDRAEPSEKDYFIFSTPCRSLQQIERIQAEMPYGQFQVPPTDWKHLARTRRILTEGGDLRLLALGDSIVNDTMRSGWVAKLQEAYPKARIEARVFVRGGGGCQHYREEGRVENYILPWKPNLVYIGGISQKDVASIGEVIRQLRAGLPEVEILLATGTFGTADPRDPEALATAPHSGTGAYGQALQALAAEQLCAYLDMTGPWAEYIRSSKRHPHVFYRDVVHANEFGEQILAKIMMAFWSAPDPADTRNSPSADRTGSVTERIWPSTPPTDCPFPQSAEVTGLAFTGEHTHYASADTWFFSWGADDRLYSPFADGEAGGKQARCWLPDADAGFAVMTGGDPTALRFSVSGNLRLAAKPYGGRYPCGSLVYEGVWYYGSYCLMNENGSIESDIQHPELGRINWGVMGPFCGFHVCTNLSGPWDGSSWMPTPFSGEKPMFPEPLRMGKAVKIGAPHFVDFGRNLQHSPDGKAYLVAHGATDDDPKPRVANLSWITGDQIYLIRVTPTVANINDPSSYEFFGGHDAGGKPVWTRSFAAMKPLLEWNNHCGCVTMTYLAPLKKYLLCITDGWPTAKTMDTYLLESDQLTGPWRLVTYLAKFGEQGFFANIPSRFVGPDGRTAWLCYSANFAGGKSDPVGSQPGLSLQRIRLLGPNPSRAN